MGLEVELSFERIVDGLDDLTQRFEQLGSSTFRLAVACRTQQRDPGSVRQCLEGTAEVVLVFHEDLSTPIIWCDSFNHRLDSRSFIGFGSCEKPDHTQAVDCRDQMQPDPPEEPGMRGANPY